MPRNTLWGLDGDLDYWTALEKGEVPEAEQKAVALLARVVDEYRFSLYCVTGQLPLMGNVTGRTFLALKSGGLLELEDGDSTAWWCFSIGPYAEDIPDTDHVVMCRTMVEGEEIAFLETGDRHERGYFMSKHQLERIQGVADPFVASVLDRNMIGGGHGVDLSYLWPDRMIGTEEILDIHDIQRGVFWYETIEDIRLAFGRPLPQDLKRVGAFGNQGPVLIPEIGVDMPYPENFEQPPLVEDAALQELADLRERLEANAARNLQQYVDQPLVTRTPYLADGSGIDLHDGTVLHVDPEAAQEYYIRTGTLIFTEIRTMLDEGYTPEMIEYWVVELLAPTWHPVMA